MNFKIKNNNRNLFLIISLIIFCYCLFSYLYKENTIENFGLKDIGKITSSVNSIGKQVGKIPQQIDKKMESLGKQIEKNTVNFFQKKMKSIFTQLGDIFKKGLIDPIFSLIVGIGSIFIFIFEILKLIVDKIISLPNCILIYVFGSIGSFSNMIYKSIMPKFIKDIISKIYSYTIKFIVDWIGDSTGYTNKSKKCYAFDVKGEISNMNDKFKKIDSNFKNNFGRLDFGSIKI